MRARLPVLLAALLPLGLPALGGEEEPAINPYANGAWDRGQEQAAMSPLVVLGRVVEAGKPEGTAWSRANMDNTDRTALSALVSLKQNAVLEVKEVLRGEFKGDRLTVRVGQVAVPLQVALQMLYRPQARDIRLRRRTEIPAAEFALARDAVYVLFLSEPKTEKDKDGKEVSAAEHMAKAMPMMEPDEQLLNSVRAFCRELADWKNPPGLSEDEERRVKELIADLGADDFGKRDRAEAALKALGARVKSHLDAAAKDADAERAFRAAGILKAIEPVAGAVEVPRGARPDAAGPAVMKEKPKPKPPEEGPPPGPPEPGPEPDPAPPAP